MPKTYAHINPEMLVWARNTVKLSVEQAAGKIKVKPEKLESWEKGDAFPTVKQLYKIADVYRRPFALFYFPAPPRHFKPLKDFRKFHPAYVLTDDEEYLLQKELILFQQKREIALELYEQLDTEPPRLKLKGSVSEPTEILADKIIRYLDINHREIATIKPGYDALNHWKKCFESKGILIFQTTSVPLEVMRGACIANDVLPVIIINSNDTQNGRIFSLFHELVHIILREDGISNFKYGDKDIYDLVEIYCNKIAAEVLVPANYLLESHTVRLHNAQNPEWTTDELRTLSNQFCVSPEVILRRLLSLDKTTHRFYQDYRLQLDFKQQDKKQSGGNYYRNIIAKNGELFLNLALQGYYQEKLTASSLADYIKVKISNLAKLEQMLYAKVQH